MSIAVLPSFVPLETNTVPGFSGKYGLSTFALKRPAAATGVAAQSEATRTVGTSVVRSIVRLLVNLAPRLKGRVAPRVSCGQAVRR